MGQGWLNPGKLLRHPHHVKLFCTVRVVRPAAGVLTARSVLVCRLRTSHREIWKVWWVSGGRGCLQWKACRLWAMLPWANICPRPPFTCMTSSKLLSSLTSVFSLNESNIFTFHIIKSTDQWSLALFIELCSHYHISFRTSLSPQKGNFITH